MEPEIYARIKPIDHKYINCLNKIDNELILNIPDNNKFGTKSTLTYCLDKIFDYNYSNTSIANEICLPTINDLFSGKNSVLIAYGAKKSGKEYTIYGNEEDNGIIQDCLYQLFQIIEAQKSDATLQNSLDSDDSSSLYKKIPNTNWHQRVPFENKKCIVKMSFVGLINGGFVDLLESINHQEGSKKFNELEIGSMMDAVNLLRIGLDSRNEIYTNHSISHKILTIKLIKDRKYTKLSIVDLAYEKKSVIVQRETESIKSSIMALRNCFEVLKEKTTQEKTIPYKESKLTWFLKNFFNSKAKIKMILCLNPSIEEFTQTCNVLKFATLKNNFESRFICSTPKVNTNAPFFKKTLENEKAKTYGFESDIEIYEEFKEEKSEDNAECHSASACLVEKPNNLNKLMKCLAELQTKDVKVNDSFSQKINDLINEIEKYIGQEISLNRRKSSGTTMANDSESFTKISALRVSERNSLVKIINEPIKNEPELMNKPNSARIENKNFEVTPKIRKLSNQIKSTLRLNRFENLGLNNGVPVANTRGQKRSKSVEVWLDHKPQNLAKLDTLMQPLMEKKNSVKKLELKDTKRSSKYVLTHQQQDEYGEVVTSLIKGDIIKSPSGGSSVIFTDIERLQFKSPLLHRPKYHKSLGISEKSPFITEDRCAIGIEGHPRLYRNRTFR